jgi:hypothetical protein
MKIANIVKGIFGKKVTLEAPTYGELVEQLAWADHEVNDTKDALLGLQFRLQNGVLVMEDIAQDAEAIIARHQEILSKAKARRSEFQGQVSQVETAVKLVEGLHTAVAATEDGLK